VQIRTLMGLAAAAAMTFVLATPATVSAQEPQPRPQTETQPPAAADHADHAEPIEGDLVSVDADAKEITIKQASGEELVIAYTDATTISGAENDAAGLATTTDAKVTVHYTEDAETKKKTATRIIVQPRG
jgi:hypothetical protein